FDPLDADAKTALIACGDKAAAESMAAARAADTAARSALAARGLTVTKPSGALRDDLARIGDARLAEWLQRTGVAGKAILDSFRA
ncbi:hypothetical protein KC220_25555, partial [Mycobacterium tuberculosis]|nr:hypothetical protein [Mycobacterium tuberculosis]